MTRTFSYTQTWVSEGWQEFGNFSKNGCFITFRMVKNEFHHFWSPLEKLLEKSTGVTPPGKHPFEARALQIRPFLEKLCCISPFGNTVQQHQCVSKPQQGDKLCTAYTAKELRNPAKLQIIYYK